ncbi:MAG: DUF362 domain-containing protein [Syntrophaceae bacterium]|nr:DUF362 domain-containing protein [Syntrophaceae bacterium]
MTISLNKLFYAAKLLLYRVYRYLRRPSVLRRIVVSGKAKPRIAKNYSAKDQVFVHLYTNEDADLKALCNSIASAWDKTDRILIKINLNTADAYPASTDPEFLIALLDAFRDRGFKNLLVGDCSSMGALPTRKVAAKAGITKALRGRAKLFCFDNEPWGQINTAGKYLPLVTVPRIMFDVDRIIHLANMKSHALADFSFGMKLGVGYMHPLERCALHDEFLQEKIAELALAVQPDLTIIDGRRAFVSGGPVHGRVEKADVVIWGENPLAVDVETYRRLYALKKKFACLEGFTQDPFAMRQLKHARQIGVGNKDWQEYNIVEI